MQEVWEKLCFALLLLCFASRGRLVNHACREQVGPQPRILVRDRDYDDTALDPPSTDPSELNEIYTTNWPSIRSSRYNRHRYSWATCSISLVHRHGLLETGPSTVFHALKCTTTRTLSQARSCYHGLTVCSTSFVAFTAGYNGDRESDYSVSTTGHVVCLVD